MTARRIIHELRLPSVCRACRAGGEVCVLGACSVMPSIHPLLTSRPTPTSREKHGGIVISILDPVTEGLAFCSKGWEASDGNSSFCRTFGKGKAQVFEALRKLAARIGRVCKFEMGVSFLVSSRWRGGVPVWEECIVEGAGWDVACRLPAVMLFHRATPWRFGCGLLSSSDRLVRTSCWRVFMFLLVEIADSELMPIFFSGPGTWSQW